MASPTDWDAYMDYHPGILFDDCDPLLLWSVAGGLNESLDDADRIELADVERGTALTFRLFDSAHFNQLR